MDAKPEGGGRLRVRVTATLSETAVARGPLNLVAVVTDSGLSSQVVAGENRGVRLLHDAVARQWLGEVPLVQNNAAIDRIVDVPDLAAGRVAVVAFVQDSRDAQVLQAVTTGFCKPD